MIELVFLGTSSAVPTKNRNHPSIYLSMDGVKMLFDCGEGTQRQLTIAGINPVKIGYIFLSHWHADHSSGLYPLLRSMQMNERKEELVIVGGSGTKQRIELLEKVFGSVSGFKIRVLEIEERKTAKIAEGKSFEVWSSKTKHSRDSYAYSFIEKDRVKINLEYTKIFGLTKHPLLGRLQKGEDIVYNGKKIEFSKATHVIRGKKITYTGDAVVTKSLIDFCHDSDVLISESTYANSEREWRDKKEKSHMLAEEAGMLAKESNAKKLYLVHFSKRYSSTEKILSECRSVFDSCFACKDFLKIKIS